MRSNRGLLAGRLPVAVRLLLRDQVLYPVAAIFISAALFILTFSFVVDDKCPKNEPDCSRREKRIQGLLRVILSYSFLIVAIIFWYFFHYKRTINNTRGKNTNLPV